ncbi:MAG: aldehyde dehydrogenase family protein [Polyangiaceae bacterium]|nr:aldehyde dehydrogenase family protein [Polyangiaceae bacterium]NUQ73036.1 aldehyde dehydrogenase family protein [Polyangiaceae bacterium]
MRRKLFLAGGFREGPTQVEIRSPFSGDVVTVADQADAALMEEALTAAKSAAKPFREVSRYTRSRLLQKMAKWIALRRHDFVSAIVDEAGKPLTLAEAEVTRALSTFAIGADEAKRYGGELFPVDIEASGRAYDMGYSMLVPRGPVLAITPFNFPLNLVAHKVVPALAVGAPILVKPAPQTPGAVALLAEVFEKALEEVADEREAVPSGAFQAVSCSNEAASIAVQDGRIATLSFTGSAPVGWMLQTMAKGKRVLLELGGNASVIVHKDADLVRAAQRCAFGAFAYAGQVCISVQNILVHRDVYQPFRELFLDELRRVRSGDPRHKETLVGPLINEAAADRILAWIEEAKQGGASVVSFGERERNTLPPMLIEGTPRACRLSSEEAFGPVALLAPYDDIEAAIETVNASRYGLQAGVFTDSNAVVRRVIADIDAGGILINEVPTFRADHMPYGGVKESGLGREGVRYAMEEYSERKTVIAWKG